MDSHDNGAVEQAETGNEIFTKAELELMVNVVTSTPVQGSLKSGIANTVAMLVSIAEKLGKLHDDSSRT